MRFRCKVSRSRARVDYERTFPNARGTRPRDASDKADVATATASAAAVPAATLDPPRGSNGDAASAARGLRAEMMVRAQSASMSCCCR